MIRVHYSNIHPTLHLLILRQCLTIYDVQVNLTNILNKCSTLTSLKLFNKSNSEELKALVTTLNKDIMLADLDLSGNLLDSKGGKEIAKALYKNITLKLLDISDNQIGSIAGMAFAKNLHQN
ncbi:3559_t:CDS:2, partial [Cetraspora pellucida]